MHSESTNMPGIGSLIHEIAVEISEMWESTDFCSVKPIPAFWVLIMPKIGLSIWKRLQYKWIHWFMHVMSHDCVVFKQW